MTKFTKTTPHGGLTKVLDNVYVIEGSFTLGFGTLFGRNMAIVKRGDDLTIINSVRVDEDTEKEILMLGTIKNLVRMCDMHGCDDAYYIDKFKPTFWSLEGLQPKPDTKVDKVLKEDSETPIEGMKVALLRGSREAVFWIPDNGGTLIACDFIQNSIEPSKYATWVGLKMTTSLGFIGECRCCVPMYRFQFGTKHWEAAQKILSWDFENLIPAHGHAKVGGAKAVTAKNIEEAIKKD